MPLSARRLLSLTLIALGLVVSATTLAGLPSSPLRLVAAVAPPNLGPLVITPTPGLDTTRSTLTTSSTAVTKGCPAGTLNVRADATGPGTWAGGVLVLGTTDQDFSNTADFSVKLSDTWAGIAASNSTPITAGTYTVKLSCLDSNFGSTGTFSGTVVFSDTHNYTSAAGPTPTPTVTATATATATPTATGTATPTTTASSTATPTTSATATSTPTATPSPTDTATAEPTDSPTPEETSEPGIAAFDGSGATLADAPTLVPGATVRVVAQGYGPDEDVTATVFSTPQLLGHISASASGVVTYQFTVPANLPAGSHRLVLAGQSQSLTLSFVVTRASATSTGGAGSTGNQLPTTGFGSGPTLALGFGLIGAGAVMTRSGRTRPKPRHAPKHAKTA